MNPETLSIPNTLICELPENIGNLANMKTLNLSGNNINSLPDSIRTLKRDKINLAGTGIKQQRDMRG